MAASGIHPKQVHELNSITEYFEPLMDFLGSLPQEERVILVGHSMGGAGISMAMEMFPNKVAVAAFVAAFMPGPDLSYVTLIQEWLHARRLDSNLDSKMVFDENSNSKPNGSVIFGPQFLASNFYQLSPPEDLILATSLIRPNRRFGDEERLREETRVSRDSYGSVAKVYIMSEQDKVIKPGLQLSMIQ
uniref:AB hydrolase-1 domain-containing protein n=2 Tax=Lotus japonicus TaxID=34305 RepID=I3SXT4_LOTJA|nr:unknown [Lotus japonicus]